MSVYVTGDTHGDFQRFYRRSFPEKGRLTRDDFVIVCGDFGGVWFGEAQDALRLDWLESLPFTTLFVCGNHENFDALYEYPVEEWHGGLVHRVRPHVLHLMRGQVFTLEGRTFFTMGGAQSVDIWDGLLDPEEPDFALKYWFLRRRHAVFRVRHLSWWQEELPSGEEYAAARRSLERVQYSVDYIITHCAPDSIQDLMPHDLPHNALTAFLEELRRTVRFRRWLFGHYHDDRSLDGGFQLLYHEIYRLLPEAPPAPQRQDTESGITE